jgi:hypothetical protein
MTVVILAEAERRRSSGVKHHWAHRLEVHVRPIRTLVTRKTLLTTIRRWSGMQRMKTKTIGLTFILCLAAGAFCFAADDPVMGTWKLNEAKSKIAPGAPKNSTVVYATAGDQIKVTVDGTDADGKPAHSEWTGKFDGKDYPVTGDATADMRSYKKEGKDTLELTNKKDGKVTVTGKVVVSADGKTRTVTINGMDAKGAKVTSTGVYDKS